MSARKGRYSPEEDDVIRRLYPSGGPGPCATMLGRSECSVQSRASKLGVRCRRVRRDRWTEEQERYCLSRLIAMSRITGHTPLGIIRHVETLVRRRLEDR